MCERMGIDFETLTEEQIDMIAHNFKKGFEWANDEWGMILEEAIMEVDNQ